MTSEKAFFRLLRDAAQGGDLPERFSLSEEDIRFVYEVSKRYDLLPTAGEILLRRGLLPQGKVAEAFAYHVKKALFRYEQQERAYRMICDAFEAAEVPFIPLKGAVLRQYYREPWMRLGRDIDILVRKEDMDTAAAALGNLGYKSDFYGTHDVSFTGGGVHIELHYTLTEDALSPDTCRVLEEVWQYASSERGGKQCVLSDEMFYFYHLAHTAKHLRNGGCGVRPILDLWIWDRHTAYDRAKREDLLEEGGLLSFARALEKLCAVWFGEEEHDEVTKALQEYIFSGGAFGGAENRAAIPPRGQNKGVWSKVWKPYAELKYWYPALEKHRCLLPFYEVRRWGRVLFGRSADKRATDKKARKNISENAKNEIRELMERLGI